jgi:hypothetical protein
MGNVGTDEGEVANLEFRIKNMRRNKMAGIFLNGGCLVWVYVISCLKFFDGGDSKPAEDFSNSPGRRRRPSRQFPPHPAVRLPPACNVQFGHRHEPLTF